MTHAVGWMRCDGRAAPQTLNEGDRRMNTTTRIFRRSLLLGAGSLALLLAGCGGMPSWMPSMPSWMGGSPGVHVDLSGSQEVPPVDVAGTGSGTITVATD